MKCACAWVTLGTISLLAGCGVRPATSCTSYAVMTPPTASADHTAAPPANSVQFSVGYQGTCPQPQLVYLPTLTTSDPVNVAVPSPGVAACVGTTNGAATLTDTASKATSLLTCR